MAEYAIVSIIFGILTVLPSVKLMYTEKVWKPAAIVVPIVALIWFLLNMWIVPTISMTTGALYAELFFVTIGATVFAIATGGDKSHIEYSIPPVVYAFLLFGGCCGSADMFHADTLYSQLEVEKDTTDFSNSIHQIPLNKMNRVSEETARNLIEKHKMGELSQKCILGEFTAQVVTAKFTITEFNSNKEIVLDLNEQPIWVAPLEHASNWKAWKNGETNGYALVFQNDPSKFFLVNKVNGEELHMQYLETALFSKDLERHLRANGVGTSTIMDDYGIEINENGRPYNTVTLMKNDLVWDAPQVIGVAIVDIQTGEVTVAKPNEVPDFVNRIYPADVIYDRIFWWGEYVHGWLNPSDQDRVRATEREVEVVYSKWR